MTYWKYQSSAITPKFFIFILFLLPDKPSMHTPEALVRSHVVYNAKVQFETYFLFVPVILSASSICTTQKGVGAALWFKCTLCTPCLWLWDVRCVCVSVWKMSLVYWSCWYDGWIDCYYSSLKSPSVTVTFIKVFIKYRMLHTHTVCLLT